MNRATRVQKLEESVYISHRAYIIVKDNNTIILHPVMG